MLKNRLVCALFVSLLGASAIATTAEAQQAEVKVTKVQAWDGFQFAIDRTVGSCGGGQWIQFAAGQAQLRLQTANQIAIAALLSGRSVFVQLAANSCTIQFLHLL